MPDYLFRLMITLSLPLMLVTAPPGSAAPLPDPSLTDAVRDYTHTLPVVPGLEGFGIDTPAGRGGQVLRVTSLEDRGPGTLREALDTPGARTIVFEIGGLIRLEQPLHIGHPYLTVAGETAPGPGITVVGAGLALRTHDVLVRHLRFRIGDCPKGPDPKSRDGVAVLASGDPAFPTRNVIIDHCSISWAVDEGASVWGRDIADITFSRNIIAENLSRSIHPKGEHSKGLLVGDHARRVAVIGNLFAHNMERNPFIKGDVSVLIAHNVIYNPGSAAIHFGDHKNSGPSLGTVLHNIMIPGFDTPRLLPLARLQSDMHRDAYVYTVGNDSGGRAMIRSLIRMGSWHPAEKYEATPVRVLPLSMRAARENVQLVLDTAGAFPRNRDAVDARIVDSVRQGAGRIIDSHGEVGGFPSVQTVRRPLQLPENPAEIMPSGYTRLEEWLFAAHFDSEE